VGRQNDIKLRLRAVDKMSSAVDRVKSKFPGLTREIKAAAKATRIINQQNKTLFKGLGKLGSKMQNIGKMATIGLTLPILAAGGAGVKMFGDFEQGLKGIEKTTGITGPALAKLGKRFDQLSTEMPVSTKEMLALAQAGGQLGISGVKNLEKFTLVLAKLSRASDVVGEDGAKAIARILNVTGDGVGKVDRFAAALVDLGNNAAASESEILAVANRVAGNVNRFDVSSAAVLGISTALKSMGKQAESSGSVMGRAFEAIDQAIRGGGKEMLILSKVTGIAQKDLKKTFQKDAAGVFRKFVFGLNKVEAGGGNMIKVLRFLGLEGVRINDILGTLVKQPAVLAENMDRASKAFKENIALQKEFDIQTNSFNSSMIKLTNTFTSLLIMVGAELAPAIEFFGSILKGIFNFLRNNPTIRTLVIVFAGLAAAMGPVLIALGFFLAILPAMIAGVGALGVALLPLILISLGVAAAIGVLIFLSVLIVKKWEAIKSFFSTNPFITFIKSMFSVLTPMGQMISGVRLLIAAFEDLDAVKAVVKDILPSFANKLIFGAEKAGGLGPNRGAKDFNRGIANSTPKDQFSGNLDINFRNAPEGTNIRANSSGPIDLNLGFAGGIQ